MSYKVDLHTHSHGSPDGGLSAADYRLALESGMLDYIAITDHNSVETALEIKASLGELGKRIIIGEEIMSLQGEVIGLYLQTVIPGGLSLTQAVDHIRQQGGLVYIPHPFESVRHGVSDDALASIQDRVDIIEIYNGRAIFQNRKHQAEAAVAKSRAVGAASSDAHGLHGWKQTYSIVGQPPTRQNLADQLRTAKYSKKIVGFGVLYPKFNRMRQSTRTGGAA